MTTIDFYFDSREKNIQKLQEAIADYLNPSSASFNGKAKTEYLLTHKHLPEISLDLALSHHPETGSECYCLSALVPSEHDDEANQITINDISQILTDDLKISNVKVINSNKEPAYQK